MMKSIVEGVVSTIKQLVARQANNHG